MCVWAQQKGDVSIPGFELSARDRAQRSPGFCRPQRRAPIIPQRTVVTADLRGRVTYRHEHLKKCKKKTRVSPP